MEHCFPFSLPLEDVKFPLAQQIVMNVNLLGNRVEPTVQLNS